VTVNRKDFGAFELHERIGTGGMASVFVGVQKSLERKVVLKILFPHLAEDAQLVARFEREARAAATLKHENIVQVIDCGRYEDVPYIAMEFIEGMDLQQWLAAWGVPPLELGLLMLRELFAGLEHAHLHHIVHRDIKPANIMFARDGTLKIMDFGLARRDSDSKGLTVMGSVLGTPAYMSPEQATGADTDERSDIFSAGVVAYELLSGAKPFEGATFSVILNSILTAEPRPLNEVNPIVPAELAAVVQRMMSKVPAERFQKSAEVSAELENAIDRLGLIRHREMLRLYAQDPRGYGDALREGRIKRYFEDGTRLAAQGPEKAEAAQLELRRVLFLDPSHRAALDLLKKLEREAARREADAARAAAAAPPAAASPTAAPPSPPPGAGPATPSSVAPPARLEPAPASAPPPGRVEPRGAPPSPPRPAPQPAARKPAPAAAVKPAGGRGMPLPLFPILIGAIALLGILLVIRLGRKPPVPPEPAESTHAPAAMSPVPAPVVAPPTAQSTPPSPPPLPATAPPQAVVPPPPAEAPPPRAVTPTPVTATTPATTSPPTETAPARPAAGQALLRVSTEPPGATVSIDGHRQSRPTNSSFPVGPGTHRLAFEKSGFYPQDMEVADLGAGESRAVGATLKPMSGAGLGQLVLHIKPTSKIFVDGVMVSGAGGEQTLKLAAGARVVRAENALGQQSWTETIPPNGTATIDYDFAVALKAAEQARAQGSVKVVTSGHDGARVLMDGKDTGLTTPCTIEHLAPGDHSVSVTLDGYTPDHPDITVTVRTGATADVKFKLKKHH